MSPRDRRGEGPGDRSRLQRTDAPGSKDLLISRRKLLLMSAGLSGAALSRAALADSLADVPPRGPGEVLGPYSERSKYVDIKRIPEAGPGMRNVDPVNAINSKAPLNKLVGIITPSDLHYERSHAGIPDLDPAKHRLLIHGLVKKPTVLTVYDLMDGAGLDRSIPLTDEILDEAFLAYGQNGEPIRPSHGFPIRLIMPGFEGNLNIKWLRRLKFGDQPWMTRWETDRYTQLRPDGKATQFQLRMDVNSVITTPSGMMEIRPGYNRITGLAWSGAGRIAKVEVSTDEGKSWQQAELNQPVLHKAQTRFQMSWNWDGKPTAIVSRSTDDKGNVQPDRKSFIARIGSNALFHYNAQQTWSIDGNGQVRNALA